MHREEPAEDAFGEAFESFYVSMAEQRFTDAAIAISKMNKPVTVMVDTNPVSPVKQVDGVCAEKIDFVKDDVQAEMLASCQLKV